MGAIAMGGAMIIINLQNLFYSIFTVLTTRNPLNYLKISLNTGGVVNGIMFTLIIWPMGANCGWMAKTGNLMGHILLVSMEILMLLRVYILGNKSMLDKIVMPVLLVNRLISGGVDVYLSYAQTGLGGVCTYDQSKISGLWYPLSDIAIDFYASVRNLMLLNDSPPLQSSSAFYIVYKYWNLIRSVLVLVFSLTITTLAHLDTNPAIINIMFLVSFMLFSWLMTYDAELLNVGKGITQKSSSGNASASHHGGKSTTQLSQIHSRV
ncbi:hypothetical protein HDV05_002449 [Chytridiales sp. JEL 0842]|nr:hypothetical protein HDV05_002449 [Chytridiales sp. JEL 0842]